MKQHLTFCLFIFLFSLSRIHKAQAGDTPKFIKKDQIYRIADSKDVNPKTGGPNFDVFAYQVRVRAVDEGGWIFVEPIVVLRRYIEDGKTEADAIDSKTFRSRLNQIKDQKEREAFAFKFNIENAIADLFLKDNEPVWINIGHVFQFQYVDINSYEDHNMFFYGILPRGNLVWTRVDKKNASFNKKYPPLN